MFEIHQQKRQVIKDVDAGEGFVELQAIEQGRLSVEETNIPKMQITMAVAHLAGRTPPIQQLRQALDPSLPFLENCVDSVLAEPNLARSSEAAILHFGKLGHLCRAAALEVPLGGSVKLRNVVGKLIHHGLVEAACLGERIEQKRLIETPHLDDPIESPAVW
jgi:hypothetical protein